MSSFAATASMAFSGSQPPCCSWALPKSAITADAWRPGGYLAISLSANASFWGVNAKLLGWSSSGASFRTAIAILFQPSCPARGRALTTLSCAARNGSETLAIHLAEHDVDGAEHSCDIGQH